MYTGDMENMFKEGGFGGSLTSLGKVTTDIYRRTAHENLELISDNLSRLSDQFKKLSNIKKPEDLISLQKECLSEDITATIQTSQKLMHLFMQNMEDLTHLYSDMRDTAISATKSAARNAVKNAEKATEKAERHTNSTHSKA